MFSEKNLINDDVSFKKLINTCLDEKVISIDTEFVRNNTYFPKLCLLQIGTSIGSYAIDPNEIKSLSPFKIILKKKNILKVFHSPRQDIEIFFNLLGTFPTNIFDTQIAYSFISQEFQISYEKLVLKILKIKLDKSLQYYDWSVRPINQSQLNYALNDVYYLRKIYFKIEKKLKDENRYKWAIEESKIYLNKNLYINNTENYWKNIFNPKTKNLNLKKLKHIFEWREKKCIRINLSRKLVFSDKDLITLLKNPKNISSFSFKYKLEKNDIKIIENILIKKDDEIIENQIKVLNQNIEHLFILKMLLKLISKELNISQNLIATNSDLEKLNVKKDNKSRLFKNWRNEIFGIKIKKFFNSELKIVAKGNNIFLDKN